MMREYKEIDKAKQLLVEGDDADYFFSAFLKQRSLTEIQIQNYGGIDELRGFLRQFVKAPGFLETVKSLGIVRDAETNPTTAFQSVSDALAAASLPAPHTTSEPTDTEPCVSVFILPDAETNGMLETVCLRSVEDDPAMFCIDKYFKCLDGRMGFLPKYMEKARVQAFLASRKKVPRMLGIAALQSIWPWDSPAFGNLECFLNAL